MHRSAITRVVLLVIFTLSAGCAGLGREPAVPDSLTLQAVVPGLEDVRYRIGIDTDTRRMVEEAVACAYKEMDHLKMASRRGDMPPARFLAISGGGDNGAFGAGLLNGWTAAGNRPVFKLVTGVSTGALTAPFAFLGADYDDELKQFYTNVTPRDILEMRSLWAMLTSDSIADNSPLWLLVEKEITREFLDEIAAEYAKGRILLVATVDLDARQSVLWNMTRIAASDSPGALHLFRSIMIASAAIPATFPPVMIDVQAAGQSYQEMHVDGGTMSQVFVYPPAVHTRKLAEQHHIRRERQLYVIRNARLDAEWAEVERFTMDIASRAISSLIQTQGVGDIYRIYATSLRDGVDFNLAYIPNEFNAPHKEMFDRDYMRALYQQGYDMAKQGFPWEKVPPGFE